MLQYLGHYILSNMDLFLGKARCHSRMLRIWPGLSRRLPQVCHSPLLHCLPQISLLLQMFQKPYNIIDLCPILNPENRPASAQSVHSDDCQTERCETQGILLALALFGIKIDYPVASLLATS